MTDKKPWEMTNKEFAGNIKALQEGCQKVSIPATKRQASKWRNKRGAAYQAMHGAGK